MKPMISNRFSVRRIRLLRDTCTPPSYSSPAAETIRSQYGCLEVPVNLHENFCKINLLTIFEMRNLDDIFPFEPNHYIVHLDICEGEGYRDNQTIVPRPTCHTLQLIYSTPDQGTERIPFIPEMIKIF